MSTLWTHHATPPQVIVYRHLGLLGCNIAIMKLLLSLLIFSTKGNSIRLEYSDEPTFGKYSVVENSLFIL
ncbi:uncharacterized protein METZ01_LOCUS173011 [marine metagenome]|uniref:Uncharacterized protein n=1 Tax=marine metagenome TaxID=408172 RepID=A0A382C401_9ZZZZ